MADFTREHDRYVVLKRTDLEAHVNVADMITLGRICADINTGRAARLAQPLRAVVVEADWPEYEPTWRAIEARMNEPSGNSGQLPDPVLAQLAKAVKTVDLIERYRIQDGNAYHRGLMDVRAALEASAAALRSNHSPGAGNMVAPCTCPSGDGSLRWPCPKHPPATGKQPLQVAQPTLWCLHVIGPDDIYPAPSKDHAEKAAELFNRTFAARAEALGITCRAEVTPWPDDAASHAAGVTDFITNFLLPGWQVDPERATRVAVVSHKDLRTALDALIDIRELKAIRSLGDLPIDRLVEEFNAQMRKPDASSEEVAQLRAAEGQANG